MRFLIKQKHYTSSVVLIKYPLTVTMNESCRIGEDDGEGDGDWEGEGEGDKSPAIGMGVVLLV